MSKNRMQKVTIVTPKGIKVECELKDTTLMELRTTTNCKIVYDNGKSGRRYFFNGVFEK